MSCNHTPRIILPVADWPITDRKLWEATLAGHGEYDEDNPATDWRPRTIKKVGDGYGRYLSFLMRRDELLPQECGATRITPGRVKAYVATMKVPLSSVSISMYVDGLLAAAKAFSPSTDWGWLSLRYSRLKHRAKPNLNKQPALRSVAELYELGLSLMEAAKARTGQPIRVACAYQQGLMIALLAVRPLRIRNFLALELGRTLLADGTGYTMIFGADELKMAQNGELNEPFPEALLPHLLLFLAVYRPALLRQGDAKQTRPATKRLWIDRYGAPMQEPAMRMTIKTVTGRAFGKAIWPHLFRDCLATSVAIEQPELMHIASVMLGHASLQTIQKHCNQAKMLKAGQKYTKALTQMRADIVMKMQGQ